MAVQISHSGGTQLRSQEKVLEDAQLSGKVNLSGRNLRDYPKSADKFDLFDTVEIDLSKNKLSELPLEVCGYTSLERLTCYNNVIRIIPEEIINLTALSYLNLSRNQLSVLPMQIYDLFLEVLIVSNNKLVSLPPDIGKLRTLMLLDASCNELDNLPSEIGKMEGLKELNIRRNHLVTIPEEISKLQLVKLDISCNKIEVIPSCFRAMNTLDVFEVDHNPLTNPPAQVCTRGRVHIFKYLATEAIKADKRRGIIEQHDLNRHPSRNPYSTNMNEEMSLFNHKMGQLRRGYVMDSGYLEGDKRWSSSEPTNDDEEVRILAERASQQKEKRRHRDDWHQSIIESRSYKPSDNHIDFIDAGEEEDGVTPTQSPVLTPTSTVDPFTKELERQKALYEEKKKQAREERLRLEVEEEEEKKKKTDDHLHNDKLNENSTTVKENPAPRRLSGESRLQKPGVVSLGDERRIARLANGSTGATTNGNRRTLSSASSTTNSIGRPRSLYLEKRTPRRATVGATTDDKRASLGDKYSNANHSGSLPNGRIKRVSDSESHMSGNPVSPERHEAQIIKRKELEDKQRNKQVQRDALYHFVKSRSTPSPTKKESSSSINSKTSPSSAFSSIKPRSAFNIGGGKPLGEGMQPNFTAKRERTKFAEELERIEQLRKQIESRLKVSLPEDLAEALMDGVVLCHLANNVRPHTISSIHVPSSAVPKLTMAKCRRNVDNFIKMCSAAGVTDDKLCSPSDILEGKGLPKVAATVRSLLSKTSTQTKQWAV